MQEKLKNLVRPRIGCKVIPILLSKIEYNLILDNQNDESQNILETIRARAHDGNKSQEATISEFGVDKT